MGNQLRRRERACLWMATRRAVAQGQMVVLFRAGDAAALGRPLPCTLRLFGAQPRQPKVAQQRRIDAIPEPAGEPLIYALIGAVGEHLAQGWGLRVPDWTQRPIHFALEEPCFLPNSRALRGALIVESPPAFRSRLLFSAQNRSTARGFRTSHGHGSPWTGRLRRMKCDNFPRATQRSQPQQI
jgi:hypothetical protein